MPDSGVTIDEFETETRAAVDAFFAYWRAEHKKNPEQWPLEFGPENAGLWTEMLVDWLTNGPPKGDR
jgi:hypothetical protein